MSNNFMESMKEEQLEDYNESTTENGAIGYKTTGSALLDINFATSSLRKESQSEIIDRFSDAYTESPSLAKKWAFFARDVRGGMGEKRLFKTIFPWILQNEKESTNVQTLIGLISEYGSWKDLIDIMIVHPNNDIFHSMVFCVKSQLSKDLQAMNKNEKVSLLAKWLPSINCSNIDRKRFGKTLALLLHMSDKEYRRTLSSLRKYIDIVESKMSSKQWAHIKYETVPSKSNIKYSKAFKRNDGDRYEAYLDSVVKGKTKINASTAFPHEVVHMLNPVATDDYHYGGSVSFKFENEAAVEALWKALPRPANLDNVLVVADGSGSMMTPCQGGSSVTALEVSYSLAMYFAELCKGQFKDKFITFSEKPQIVDLSGIDTVSKRVLKCFQYGECSNTNIEATFKLILDTAVKNKMTQADLPKTVLVISDMEFDRATDEDEVNKNLFRTLNAKYKKAGYSMPKLVFWNVCSRTNTIPVRNNNFGVALVSGFSTSVVNMVLSNEIDPYKCLVNMLMTKRYEAIN